MLSAEAIETLVANTAKPQIHAAHPGGLSPFALVPHGYNVKPLNEFRTTPERIRQRVKLLTADAFVAYWKRYETENSVIFADARAATYTAVIDYHSANGVPAWCSHVAVYECLKTPEWEIWTGNSGKRMSQAEFAVFIEDNYTDVVKPSHAEMLQIATGLSATKSVKFASGTRLQDGQTQLLYQEEIKGSVQTKSGQVKVPQEFTIGVPVFLGGKAYTLDARLRYRISDEGQLSIWYDLHRPHKVIEAATHDVTGKIVMCVGAGRIFLGAAGGS